MGKLNNVTLATGLAVVLTSAGCAQLSREPTEREQTAAIGGLAGGATGAIIGAFAGGATAGGLFGIPLGAAAGYYIGDQLASRDQAGRSRMEEQERELERLRRENERLRREDDRSPARSQSQQGADNRGMAQAPIQSEQNITNSGATSSQQRSSEQSATRQPQSTTGAGSMSQSQQSSTQMASSQRVSMSPRELRQVQQKLNEQGFNAGHVDGVWGPNTEAALKNFQQAKGLQATGRLNDETVNALGVENVNK